MFPVIAVTAALLAVAVASDVTGAVRRGLARPDVLPSDAVLLGLMAVLLAGAALAWRRIAELRGEVARRRSADAMLHAGLDNVPSVVYAVDRAGRLILVNRSFERTFSVRAEDAVGRTAAECAAAAPGDTFAASDQRALALDEALEVEETVHVRGDVRTFASTKFVLRDGAAKPYAVCSISNDVTARRKTEEALLQAQKVEGMGQLAGGVAHDLNNVLSVIIGQSELLGLRLDAGSALARRLGEIRKAASLGASLTRQLLAFSRRETLKPQILGLNGLVEDVAQMLGRLIGEQVRLSVRCDPEDVSICADPTHLQQLLLNLAVNARDAMPGGGALTIETARVDLDAEHAGRHAGARVGPHARLRVRDTGCGIEPELMPRIFEPFFTTKVKGRGTGLGLSTVSDVVKRGGGHLTVHSVPGQGTTFDVYWPLAGGATVVNDSAIDGRPELGGTETVLYVEDDPGLLRLGADLMREAGYNVLLAADAREALAIAACDPWRIDVLVTDVVLPGLHGPELWHQLAHERPGLPVVYVTGYLGDPQVLRLGSAARLVEKPFTGEELLRGVRRCLDAGWNPPAQPGEAWPSGLRSSVRRAVTGMLVGGLLAAASAHADPAPADTARRWQLAGAWNQSHGLPQERVYTIAQTRDGYLWLGTRGGVARFDGVRFKTFDDRAAEAIGDNEVWALVEDGAALWIGTYGGGLSHLEAGRVTSHTTRQGLVNDFVRVLARDSEGALWIGTDGGLSRMHEGRFTNFRVAEGLAQPVVKALAADAGGGVWVATQSTEGSGLHHVRSGRVERVALPGVDPTASIEALRPTAEGAVWLGTGDGLVHWEGGAATRYTVSDGLSSNRIRALHEDARGLWIATERGVDLRARWSNTFRNIVGEASANDPTTLLTDAEGNLWVGTRSRGLARFDEGLFSSYTEADGIPSTDVTAVLEDTQGTLWVGTSRGLAARTPAGFRTLGPASGLEEDPVFSLMEDGAGHLWVGTDSALFRTAEALPAAPRFVAIEGVPRTTIRSLHTDREGAVWIGTNAEGLLRHDQSGLTPFGARQGLSHGAVRAIAETRDGSLWVGTKGGGLNRLHHGRFTVYATKDGLPSDSIQALHVDSRDVLWVATRRGLARLKDGRFSSIGRGQGLLANHVYGFAEDPLGNLWMTCGRGVFRVSREQLDAVADGSRTSLFSVAYGREHGLSATVGAVSDDPVAWRARDGRLYFAMSGGLAAVDPGRLSINERPPPVELEEVTADGRPVDVTGPAAVVPPGRGDLMLRYTALSFVAPEKVTFRYRLEGFDREWVEAGSRRVAFYTNVPPGSYRFQVIGCNSDGVCNEQGASALLTLQTRFYRTTWFLAACLLGVAAAGLGAHRLRLRQVEARERELSARVEDAVAQLQTLKGLLPICSSCKSIRDDEGSWNQMEAYIQDHSAAEFTHGICPGCAEKMFPGRGFRVVTGTH